MGGMIRVEQRDAVARFIADAAVMARRKRAEMMVVSEANKEILRAALDTSIYIEWMRETEERTP